MLQLNKPIVFFDLEGTGVDPYNDRIVQLAGIKFFPDGTQKEFNWTINPKVPIPADAAAVHGITDEMVKDKPTLGDLAAEISQIFLDTDLGGYNIKYYDVPLLQSEFDRIGLKLDTEQIKLVDAMMIFKIKEPRTLQAAYAKYVGGTFENAHDAMTDIKASIAVLEGQMKMYSDVPQTPKDIHEYCFPKDPNSYDSEGKLRYVNGNLTINFGKNRGRTLEELRQNDPGYLEWIMNGNFSEKVKKAVRESLK